MLTPALTRETASAYISNYHAKFGGCRVAWALPATFEGLDIVKVKFWHDGFAAIAWVWVECGQLYGEW